MGTLEDSPANGANSSTTSEVADLISALSLPFMAPLASDVSDFSSLPPLPIPSPWQEPTPDGLVDTSPAPYSQLELAHELMDNCVTAIESLRKHQNQCAALAAVLIERLHCSVNLEGSILGFDRWQLRNSLSGIQSDLAMVLQIPEGSANRLMEHSTTLVRHLPATMEHLHSGDLAWEHAVVIAEEVALLKSSGVAAVDIDDFEQRLLAKADGSTLPSFREKARRLRERLFPESIVPRSRRAYADRQMTKSRARDGMSWLSFYAPAPTVEAIWDQCTATSQAAQGPHEDRTLTQLRVDVAAALLLNQSLSENRIFAPVADLQEPCVQAGNTQDTSCTTGSDSTPRPGMTGSGMSGSESDSSSVSEPGFLVTGDHTALIDTSAPIPINSSRAVLLTHLQQVPTEPGHTPVPLFLPPEPVFLFGQGSENELPEQAMCNPWQIPVFDDPDYSDPSTFIEPDVRNSPDWIPNAKPPLLQQVPMDDSSRESGSLPDSADGCGADAAWAPLPKVSPIVLIPALSLLGVSDEPAWMEGAGPISIEVAKRLASNSPTMYRLLVDPLTGLPLDYAPDRYRVSKAMRTALQIRDEYCQFPGCMAKACSSEIDHIKKFEDGGRSTINNLEVLCLHHHLLKHFKDDRTRSGQVRTDQSPDRQSVRLRGWTPQMTETGRVSWTSPTGRYYPAEVSDPQLPQYPLWLQLIIEDHLARSQSHPIAGPSDVLSGQELDANLFDDDEESYMDGTSSEAPYDLWSVPEMPAVFEVDECGEALLTALAIRRGMEDPTLGLPDAA